MKRNSLTALTSNLALLTDSYKIPHWLLFPTGMRNMSSYIEARGTDVPFLNNRVVWFGLQYILKRFFEGRAITVEEVEEAAKFAQLHLKPGVFNYEGWMSIAKDLDGRLPLVVRALEEGSVVPTSTALMTVEATDEEKYGWLVTYLEPLWLQVWYPTTVATISFEVKQILKEFWSETVDEEAMAGISFALHDFGFRGTSSTESAMIGGMGHILNFSGTDTMAAIAATYDFYNLDWSNPQQMPAFSVIASEHTVMCANSDADKRVDYDAVEKMVSVLEDQGPGTIVSAVGDTYDIYRFAREYVGGSFMDRIKASGGRFVVRPDSGDPLVVPIDIIEILMDCFGYTVNKAGYRVLPDCIRVLQGDGVNAESIREILTRMKAKNISAENIVFGMGGALLQHCDRDWLKFAMKASAVQLEDGTWKDVFKDPITDSRKTSKRGRLTTYRDKDGKLFTDRVDLKELPQTAEDQMIEVFREGVILVESSFDEIRSRVSVASANL